MGGGETSFVKPERQMVWDEGSGGMAWGPMPHYTESLVLPDSFWDQPAPAGLTAKDAAAAAAQYGGAGLLGRLGNQGYFNQFSDWGQIAQQVGDYTAAGQASVDGGDGGFGGLLTANYVHLGNMVDDITHGKLPGITGDASNIWGAPSKETNAEISSRGADTGPNMLLHSTARNAALMGVGSSLSGGGAAPDGSTGPYGGFDNAAVSGAEYGSSGGGGMWDFADQGYFGDDYGYDYFGAEEYGGSQPFVDGETGAFDQYGWDSPTGDGGSALDYSSPMTMQTLQNALRSSLMLRSLLGGGGGGTMGRGMLDSIMGDPFGSAFNMTPFLLALYEANKQKNDVVDITNQLQDLKDEVSTANVQSMVLNPYDRDTARGREGLLSSLGQRNVLGSSFGNQDILSYDTTRSMGRGDLATKAMLGKVGTQGALLDQILQGTNKMHTNKNLLLGAGLNASGRLFQQRNDDPFGISKLLGL